MKSRNWKKRGKERKVREALGGFEVELWGEEKAVSGEAQRWRDVWAQKYPLS